ncbi:MAG: CoA transferase [Actinomycetota bacterium]
METDQPTALDGLRVLDVTQVMAGSYCGLLLADLGADVIKVERPGIGDVTRLGGAGVDAFAPLNRNKRSIAVDHTTPQGADVLRRLADDADVLVENQRPGSLERHGLGYDDLAARNRRLVYCSISGFGQVGPRADRKGFDLMAQAMSGLMAVTGEPDRDPVKVGVPIADLSAGIHGTVGILAALVRRGIDGLGQRVTTSLLETAVATMVWESMLVFQAGETPGRGGSAHRLAAPYEAFPTADGFIAIAAHARDDFRSLCHLLGRDELATDPRFARGADRLANRAALADELGVVLRTRTTAEWDRVIDEANIAVAPVNSMDEVFADPQILATEMVVGDGRDRRLGHAVKLSATPMSVRRPSPVLGEHTVEVLTEAGYDRATIDELAGAEAIAIGEPVTEET